ncbi:MAG: 2Fe-2S iron-sulfur cluster-binding protein [Bacteroidota bacterium]|nr:2Fe-2S iron-sulfur cluster-binding protein [Bacteroidota bacterium]MEC9209894.1 2Fe-2S iron-sulfur cluster-binding protein [Bacteroidota bacterium]
MSTFQSLVVKNINRLTKNAVEISFDVLKSSDFNFLPGQYITIKHQINREEVRRAYSICSSPSEGLSIGVKLVEQGKMSSFLTSKLKVGDSLEVMPANGNFIINGKKNHIVGICAGSGVTPILSMIKSEMENSKDSKFTLIYGNKTQETVMFYNELKDLVSKNPQRLKIHWVFSREKVQSCVNGRIDKNNLQHLINTFKDLKKADDFFICGPGEVIDNAKELLLLNQINQSQIHFERFTAVKNEDSTIGNEEIISNITVCIDGEDFEFILSNKGQTILDAAMEHGADVPFSCKGAVCCTCKAKVMEGKVTMDANYSLSEEEISEGFVLGCQSHPASENVVIDFDEM